MVIDEQTIREWVSAVATPASLTARYNCSPRIKDSTITESANEVTTAYLLPYLDGMEVPDDFDATMVKNAIMHLTFAHLILQSVYRSEYTTVVATKDDSTQASEQSVRRSVAMHRRIGIRLLELTRQSYASSQQASRPIKITKILDEII